MYEHFDIGGGGGGATFSERQTSYGEVVKRRATTISSQFG